MAPERDTDLVALDVAHEPGENRPPKSDRGATVFGGLSVEETAEALKISPRTVMREWGLAQAWLYRELSRTEKAESRRSRSGRCGGSSGSLRGAGARGRRAGGLY